MRDVCDIAYVLWWERVEREQLVLWQASIIAGAMGSTVEVPPLHVARERFDADLAEPPQRKPVDRVRDVRLRVLGVVA